MTTPTPTITETPTCGKSFKRKIKGGALKTYKCTKPVGHDVGDGKTPHGLTTAVKQVKLSTGLQALTSFETVPETELVPLVARERDEVQRTVDQQVKEAHNAWIQAGKPEAVKDRPRKRYLVPAEDEDAIRTLLRRAGEFHRLRVQIAPGVKHESGNVSIQFSVIDRAEKPKPSETRNQNTGN